MPWRCARPWRAAQPTSPRARYTTRWALDVRHLTIERGGRSQVTEPSLLALSPQASSAPSRLWRVTLHASSVKASSQRGALGRSCLAAKGPVAPDA
jgi:hypothetical protein